MKKFMFGFTFLLGGLILYLHQADSRVCKFRINSVLSIATVTEGLFLEMIPQTGTLDTSDAHNLKVKVEIDKMYVNRISVGLKATSTSNGSDISLAITEVDTTIADGRFSIVLIFTDSVPKFLDDQMRLRIELNKPRRALLLPIGGFYKDTGGKWVFVLDSDNHVMRRDITLGAKNTECFEVLRGLKPGDHVITSSYEDFLDRRSVELSEIKGSKEVVYVH
jgi:HlyD family secretion protein